MKVIRGLLINDKQILLPSQHSSVQLWMKITSSPISFFIHIISSYERECTLTRDSVCCMRWICVWKCDVCDGIRDAWGAGEAKFLREKKRSCKIVSEFYFSVFPFFIFLFFAGRRRRSQQSSVLEFA